jgi:2,3-bisphosphoglycerate-dependent phosphoglycerate mutase
MFGAGEGAEMRNIYIVRHTESVHHVQKLGGGWYDTSLTEKGKAQAAKIATNLFDELKIPGIPIYSSDLKRCSEMAAIFSKTFNSPIILDKNLREMKIGDAGGKSEEWQKANVIPQPVEGNRLDHRAFNGAETRREVGKRAYAFWNQALKNADENIIVITHGFMTTFLILAWMKIPVENMDYAQFPRSSGVVTLLNEDDFWHNRNVIYTNKTDYLLK